MARETQITERRAELMVKLSHSSPTLLEIKRLVSLRSGQ